LNHKPNILAIIPARGGSKGIPGKNSRIVDSKPLICYTIEAAQNSKMISEFVVSTDDNDIEEIANTMGANVLRRPPELATDDSNVIWTVFHVLEEYKKYNKTFDIIVLLQPTFPLRSLTDIDNAINLLLNDQRADAVISVIKVGDSHPSRMYRMDENNSIASFIDTGETNRRQDLESLYIRNGALYIVRVNALFRENTLMPRNKKAYLMDARWSINIDEEIDLDLLEAILPKWKEKYGNFNN
jgi:CMP-N,N'-diacetyllegionaminic acid synthase